jgi:hypothetical protein
LMYTDPFGLITDGAGKYHTRNPKEHLPLPSPEKKNCINLFGIPLLCDPPSCADVSPNYQACHTCCATSVGNPGSNCYIGCSFKHKDPTNPNPDLGLYCPVEN